MVDENNSSINDRIELEVRRILSSEDMKVREIYASEATRYRDFLERQFRYITLGVSVLAVVGVGLFIWFFTDNVNSLREQIDRSSGTALVDYFVQEDIKERIEALMVSEADSPEVKARLKTNLDLQVQGLIEDSSKAIIELAVKEALKSAKSFQDDSIVERVAIPTGAVMAFALSQCPPLWVAYEPAQGRFIRGVDPNAKEDERRGIGSIQLDAFQGHFHQMDTGGSPGLFDSTQGRGPSARAATTSYSNRLTFRVLGPIDGQHGPVRVASETRPKNVALLFCKRL